MSNERAAVPMGDKEIEFQEPGIWSKVFSRKTLRNTISVAALFVIWSLLVEFRVYRFALLPPPGEVLKWGVRWVGSTDFWIDVSLTTLRVFSGVFMACLVGIPLGLMIGWKKVFADFTFPTLEVLRPIPGIAYIPLAILFFPWEEASVAFICFVGAFFPILLNRRQTHRQRLFPRGALPRIKSAACILAYCSSGGAAVHIGRGRFRHGNRLDGFGGRRNDFR
jgi:uncharacterized membrane protein YqaE (UPF0057 family)